MNKEDMVCLFMCVCVHTQQNYYSAIKIMKSCHLQQYDGPTGYYGKWDKSIRKTNTVWPYLQLKSKKQNK